MHLQPTLVGTLVTVRPLVADDWAALYAVAADPLIWEQHPNHDRWREEVFAGFFATALASGGALAVLDATTGAIIGSSRYHGYDAARSQVEIGWTFLARAYWGGRYNGELKQLMLTHALAHVERVVFFVGLHNIRSQTAVQRIGGVRVADRPNSAGVESACFEITRATFAAAGARP
ncbi:MAG: GNAT family N-acetyltransferase [Gemmatimonadaceae bacterium]|jgi:RimJ/RimL family protein N-acetyltransferase|nr:GNAT family N-acetyltransferase [Gemmatimonadaceae bacterium]